MKYKRRKQRVQVCEWFYSVAGSLRQDVHQLLPLLLHHHWCAGDRKNLISQILLIVKSPQSRPPSTSITLVIPPALILTYRWIWFKCLSTECIVKMKVKLCLLHSWGICSRWKWRNKILHFGRLHVNGRPLCSNYPRSGPALFCIQKIPIIPKWRKYGKIILTIPALKIQEKYKMQKIYHWNIDNTEAYYKQKKRLFKRQESSQKNVWKRRSKLLMSQFHSNNILLSRE